MASTIQLKRGSGAPTSGDLAAGELGLDLTNNKIYSSTTGSDVVLMSDPSSIEAASAAVLTLNRTTSLGSVIDFKYNGTSFASIGRVDGIASDVYFANTSTGIRATTYISINSVYPCDENGAYNDNLVDLGFAGSRWDDVYATNGTIQTSDVNEKQDVEELSDVERIVAVKCKALLRKYRWKDSVAEKNDDARIHFGIIAQDLKAAFESEGLDAGRYGMFISSTWTDESGVEHTRLGVRYNQLFAFVLAAI